MCLGNILPTSGDIFLTAVVFKCECGPSTKARPKTMAARRLAVLGGHLSGIGGIDLGFKWAGIEIVWAKCVSADDPYFPR